MRIVVIGGGPGGLCLGQGLKRHGFDVRVFERDPERTDYLQGFRLRIRDRGEQALRACLSDTLFDAYRRTCGRAPTTLRQFDEQLHPLAEPDPLPAGDDTQVEKSVSRITLRQILLSGLAGVLETGRAFERYEIGADGRPTAFFADGAAVQADLLIGADGANSLVRRQLLPHARWVDTGARRIGGKIALDAGTRTLLAPWLLDGTTTIKAAGGISVFITSHWQAGPRDTGFGGNDAAARRHGGLLFDNTVDYLFWAFAAKAPPLPDDAELTRLGSHGQHALVNRIAERWHPDLQQLFRHTDPNTVGVLPIRSSLPVAAWPTQRVTLLGDALHSMTYFRAFGANSALHDAHLLVRELLAVRDGAKPLADALADYEARMRRDGFDAVRASLRAFQRALDVQSAPSHWPSVAVH